MRNNKKTGLKVKAAIWSSMIAVFVIWIYLVWVI